MKTKIIILAAGKGTRMGSELPKVLVPVQGKPMIHYLMEAVMASAVDSRPVVVVAPWNKDVISESLNSYDLDYAIQDQQLGTGHAVACARSFVGDEYDNILVLYGDQPFLQASSIKSFADSEPQPLTVVSTLLPDFENWHHNFFHLGRIARNDQGKVCGIVEFKDASDQEKEIREINLGFMCFKKNWLFSNIDSLKDNNNAHEFYLTDMVKIAFQQGHEVKTINVEPREAMGINSKEELAIAEGLVS
jgi:bifunctional UDP-N-acetylglucosamine pyrophosphorylase/glucosamine-1-phosphate N-acetyltransferase